MGSTYRVQLHAGFDFDRAAAIAGHVAGLGVSHLYLSPILMAVPGSTHGYDVVDHSRINPDLGGEDGYRRLTSALTDAGLGQVLDIVPNHMATDGRANRWWWDVLENGPSSPYAPYFDIDWDPPDRRLVARVLVPVLGDHYGRVLEAGEVRVAREGGTFVVHYFDHELPISPRTIDGLLERAAAVTGSAALADFAASFAALPHALVTDPDAVAERHADKTRLAEELRRLCEADDAVAAAVDAEAEATNTDIDLLDDLVSRQNFRLAYWRTAAEDLDYRRFFNIETLVGLRAERGRVFSETHRLVVDLVRDGVVDGLRVDHIDGLLDPRGYLEHLSTATRGTYVVVEKILGADETLPSLWPVAGTTGYEFIARANGVFVDPATEGRMTDAYRSFTSEDGSYADLVHGAKVQIMETELTAEVDRLSGLLAAVCEGHRRHRDHTRRELRSAVRELLAAFPVYRIYPHPDRETTADERGFVTEAVAGAAKRNPDTDEELLPFLGGVLLGDVHGATEAEFAARFAQVSGAVMAKGVEDTAFYRYNRLVSLNEVGGDPDRFGVTTEDFHVWAINAAEHHPEAMLTLETHDTKRSADVRARINVLAEIAGAWDEHVARWAEHNDHHRRDAPDSNTEYLLYQTLVGAWPIATDRVVAAMAKSAKEAKVHTSWVNPDPAYDEALERFVVAVLSDPSFLADFTGFLAGNAIVERGRRSSLAQTALLLTCPGRPDVYQGSEVWKHTLVDPDNRGPVDYDALGRLMAELDDEGLAAARRRTEEGGPKAWLIRQLLRHRQADPDSYGPASGYEPLDVTGPGADEVVAFARTGGLAVVVPRLGRGGAAATVRLPAGSWHDLLTDEHRRGGDTAVADLLAGFPVAVLRAG